MRLPLFAGIFLALFATDLYAEGRWYGATRRDGYYDRHDRFDRYGRWDHDCDDRDVYIFNQYNYPNRRYSYQNDVRYPSGIRGRGGRIYGEPPSTYAPGIGTSFPSRPNRASRPFWR